MTVEALVVNDILRTNGNNFVRNQMAYNVMQQCGNGQPGINNNDTNFTIHSTSPVPPNQVAAGEFYNGVYLKWRLPKAFTHGTQDSVKGVTQFPLVPNRWLIVRYSGPLASRRATAWIVESDYLYPDDKNPSAMNASEVACIYVQPDSDHVTPVGVPMGRNVLLGAWSESGHDLKLTAMAPGNPAFAFYQPQCNNVFSFIDCLDAQPPETLSYLVCGWFSNTDNDPLAPPGLAEFDASPSSHLSSTLTFSATSASQVAWTAGSITAPDGTVYNITAGKTDAMVPKTYIYLDPAVSASTLQTTAIAATARASGCVFIATATPFFAVLLDSLGWTLPKGTDPTLTASWSMLYGAVNGVQWQNTTLPPGGAPTQNTEIPVSIAVGNSSVEALTAMISAQAGAQNMHLDSELLEAFQLDLVDAFDRPDGAAILEEKLQASFFQKFSGGYVWNIVDAPNSTTPVSGPELKIEQAWLATLNQNQTKLDEALRHLAALQTQLYGMWWKYTNWVQAYQGSTTIQKLSDQSELQKQLDPTVSGSLAQLTAQQMSAVQSLVKLVPGGRTPDELTQAIQSYSTQQKLPATRLLKRSPAPHFYLPNNPVVLIAGAGASGIVQSADSILCRFPSQLISGFNYNLQTISTKTLGLSIPQPDLSQVSGMPWSAALAADLVQEFFFLDPNNATMASAAISGSTVQSVQQAMSDSINGLPVYPAGAVQQWVQNPWHPLLLYWQARYYPIEYGTPQKPNWRFDNGQYLWNGSPHSISEDTILYGLIQLAPTANFNMAARIKAFLNNNPHLDPLEIKDFEALLDFVQYNDNWDVLSQALDGFNNQLQLGTPGVFLSPSSTKLNTSPSLSTLIGSATGYPPDLGNIPNSAQSACPESGFMPWRAGQFEFIQLILIDEWGQALWPIDSLNYQKETVYIPADLSPVQTSTGASFSIVSGTTIDSIIPNLTLTDSGPLTFTVNGVNFASGSIVHWGSTELTTTFVSATQLTAMISAAQLQTADSFSVTVNSGGVVSNAAPFTIADGLAIGSLNPNLLQAGMVSSSEFAMAVTGVGFTPGAIVQWNGIALATEFIASTRVIATVPANFAFAPGVAAVAVIAGNATSNSLPFTLSAGAAIVSLTPNLAVAGSTGFVLTVNGVGFEPTSVVQWNGAGLATSFVSSTELTAEVTAQQINQPGSIEITVSVGAKVLLDEPDSLIQLPPALLQPARLNFDLISGHDDSIVFGPANPDANPVCGWLLPNHLDGSLMAYDASGVSLGEMSVAISLSNTKTSDTSEICWTPAPNSPYTTLDQIHTSIPNFGDFLLSLSRQPPAAFKAFLTAIDETLWTTAPMGASFDQSLAVLIGRPLAMVRARLQFVLDGLPITDPSWQYTFVPAPEDITTYKFAIELGNLAQLKDGLIGYFVGDNYDRFNVVAESAATEGNYLKPIGQEDNYIYMPFDGKTSSYVSMLVDPYAAVHATTGILPVTSVSLPPQFTADALAAMNVTFRVDGILTDQQIPATGKPTILMPVPKEKAGVWSWLEKNQGAWDTYGTAPNDTAARLSNVLPVLRRGLLQLSSALTGKRK
jgi:hypothetical protein